MLIVYLFIDSTQRGLNLQFKPTTALPAPFASLVSLPVQGRWGGPLSLPQPILESRQQEEVVKLQGSLGCVEDADWGLPGGNVGDTAPF